MKECNRYFKTLSKQKLYFQSMVCPSVNWAFGSEKNCLDYSESPNPWIKCRRRMNIRGDTGKFSKSCQQAFKESLKGTKMGGENTRKDFTLKYCSLTRLLPCKFFLFFFTPPKLCTAAKLSNVAVNSCALWRHRLYYVSGFSRRDFHPVCSHCLLISGHLNSFARKIWLNLSQATWGLFFFILLPFLQLCVQSHLIFS